MVIFILVLAAGCGRERHAHDDRLTVAGGTIDVHSPATATRVGVVVLHSLGHTSAEPVAQGWSKAADKHAFVGIYPYRGSSWNAGLCCGSAAARDRDDVTWLVSVIGMVKAKYRLTTIYLAGNSNGGMMIERLVAEHPDVSSRFAVWGSAPEMPTAGTWTGNGNLYDGAGDTTIRWRGGTVMISGVSTVIRPAQTTIDWLHGAHLRSVVIAKQGHAPERSWPDVAWAALTR